MNTESLEAARAVCIPQETVLEDVKLAHACVPFGCTAILAVKSLARDDIPASV